MNKISDKKDCVKLLTTFEYQQMNTIESWKLSFDSDMVNNADTNTCTLQVTDTLLLIRCCARENFDES